jgi:hypothetical protein
VRSPPEKARVLDLAGLAAGTPVKVKPVDAFFTDASCEEAWHDDQEKDRGQRAVGRG